MSTIRHKISTKLRVIELYEAGWLPAEIQELLRQEGIEPAPSRNTIWAWTHPRKAEKQARRDLAKTRRWRTERASFSWPGVRGPEWKLERMRRLRDTGLSYAAIAKVMSFDFPSAPLTASQVEGVLRGLHTPIALRSAA